MIEDEPGIRLAIDFHPLEEGFDKYKDLMLVTDRWSGYTWDYYLQERSARSINTALKHLLGILERQHMLKPRVIECDNELTSVKPEVQRFLERIHIRLEPAAPRTQEQNGAAERMGGVIKMKARAMRQGAKLPTFLWPEVYRSAVYLYNRTPKYIYDWKSPYERLHTFTAKRDGSSVTERKPMQAHLRVYGCKAFAMTPDAQLKRNRLQRLNPRAWVGYLVGYNSTNIYRIWNPITNKVIVTRDVAFNENSLFSGNMDDLKDDLLRVSTKEYEEWLKTFQAHADDANTGRPEVRPEEYLGGSDTHGRGTDHPFDPGARNNSPSTPAPSLPADLQGEAVHVAMKLHRKHLPPLPRHHAEVKKHPMKQLFEEAEQLHLQSHEEMNTWEEVPKYDPRCQGQQILDCMWVYVYKTDKHGKFIKCKARLVVRGDQQRKSSNEETYASTLAGRSFRALMAIAARFDLELKQFDAVNAFVNASVDHDVFMKMPPGYHKKGTILRILKALYGMRESPLLWQKEFTKTLKEIGFEPIPHEPCTYKRNGVLVFFYVDDIVLAYSSGKEAIAKELIEKIKKKYHLTGGGDLQWFLGIAVLRDRSKKLVWLSQADYLDKISGLVDKGGGDIFEVSSDASFADNTRDRKSSQAYVMKLFGGVIGWRANKQSTVTTSTTEAELLALSQAAKEAMFTIRLIKELGVKLDDSIITIHCDNNQTINLVQKDIAKLQTKLRHVDIHNHWLRQEYDARTIQIVYRRSSETIADGLTKVLTNNSFRDSLKHLNLVDIKDKLAERNEMEVEDEIYKIQEQWDSADQTSGLI
ncbi:hypothetical protein ABKA04_002143 [Annulohypoxylon sp. FPYF3050]